MNNSYLFVTYVIVNGNLLVYKKYYAYFTKHSICIYTQYQLKYYKLEIIVNSIISIKTIAPKRQIYIE